MKVDTKEILLNDGEIIFFKSHDPQDAQKVLDMQIQCAAETYFLANYPEEQEKKTAEKVEEWLRSAEESENSIVLGVYGSDGKCIGHGSFSPVMGGRLKTKHRAGFGLSLINEYQGRGLGTLLSRELISLARKAGYEKMELGVFADNGRAIHLYNKIGFTEICRIPDAFKLKDGTYRDEIIMSITLK